MTRAQAELDAPVQTRAQRNGKAPPFAEGLAASAKSDTCQWFEDSNTFNLSFLSCDDLPDEITALIHEALAADASCPKTYAEARRSPDWPKWEKAILEELAKMNKYGVWTELKSEAIKGLKGKALSGRWVFTRKISGTTGLPTEYKARWVVKGYEQRAGIDYVELYAGVVHKDTLRVLLALTAMLDHELDQVDIKAAFLNGELEETIHVRPPEGSDVPAGTVLRLNKSLYGLKQSPRCFNKKLDKWFAMQGLKPTSADPCLYIKRTDKTILLVSVHVDDQLIACNSRKQLDDFKSALNAAFKCKDGGPADYFLGFNIHRDRPNRKLYISQEHYLTSMLERFDMSDSKPARAPLPAGYKGLMGTDEEDSKARHEPYREMVGALLYAATISRPDVSFAVNLLARTTSKWNKSNVHAARHLLRYIKGTTDLCLAFDSAAGNCIALGYADADWGGCLETRRSTTGYMYTLGSGPVAWKSKRQATTALSTMEAEYMASSSAARQASWLRQLLLDIGHDTSGPLKIYNDNNAALSLLMYADAMRGRGCRDCLLILGGKHSSQLRS